MSCLHIEPPHYRHEPADPTEEHPEGMLERDCESAIHNLVSLYGFGEARELIAEILAHEGGEDATKWLRS